MCSYVPSVYDVVSTFVPLTCSNVSSSVNVTWVIVVSCLAVMTSDPTISVS